MRECVTDRIVVKLLNDALSTTKQKEFGIERVTLAVVYADEVNILGENPQTITENTGIYLKRLRWAGHVARMGESRKANSVLVGRSEEKRPLGRPRRKWENNIKMDLKEVEYDGRVD
ncbi:hypothetical protein ANN_11492 [Periplaneta americana]|uniref:Uncharacterized protein n=1 Tax=Periplaneta americana TaxID=6978 RepID=A0ABQ8T6J0_PERAM|nr:hypothetical protein ANN_11492 [Periplaneta americana]